VDAFPRKLDGQGQRPRNGPIRFSLDDGPRWPAAFWPGPRRV